MRDQSTTAPTRVIVLDLVSFVLLATAAGLAIGVTLAGMALLFASQTAHADAPVMSTSKGSMRAFMSRGTESALLLAVIVWGTN